VLKIDRRFTASLGHDRRSAAITVFEIRFGLEVLAKGRKRKALDEAFASALDEDFDGRVLAFDRPAADAAAAIEARRPMLSNRVRIAWPSGPVVRAIAASASATASSAGAAATASWFSSPRQIRPRREIASFVLSI
jgi:hypothetical protein